MIWEQKDVYRARQIAHFAMIVKAVKNALLINIIFNSLFVGWDSMK